MTDTIRNSAQRLQELLNDIDETEDLRTDDQDPQELAWEAIMAGKSPEEALTMAAEKQKEKLAAPLKQAVAEKALGDVLKVLERLLRLERDDRMSRAEKGLQDALKAFRKRYGKEFPEENMELAFKHSISWRDAVNAFQYAGDVPILFKSSFPFGWASVRFDTRPLEKSLTPHQVNGETGSGWPGLHRLAERLLNE